MPISEEIVKKATRLRAKIKRFSRAYHERDQSLTTDANYDALVAELRALENAYPELQNVSSPTQTVGGTPSSRFVKVSHSQPMLSLSNAFNEADLKRFDSQIKRLLNIENDINYLTELKIDGLSVALIYENGKLVRALTRGNGEIGEDVTNNVRQIKNIPPLINYAEPLEVRGEIYMPLDVFAKLNADGAELANPRNAAAGTLRQLDIDIVKSRHLSSFLYAVTQPEKHHLKNQSDILTFLKKLQFNTNEHAKMHRNIDDVNVALENYAELRKNLNYDTDGVVVKVNEIALWNEIGFVANAPKFMTAYKFPAEIKATKLLSIFATVGRTGRITYNAHLAPVQLGGTTVTAATLHNADYVKELGINTGDIVSVKKAGEIIPKVTGLITKVATQPWVEVAHCPACNSLLVRQTNEVDQYCPNEHCPQRNIAKLEHFCSRNAMNIDLLSTKTLELFIREGLISDIASIFDLPQKQNQIRQLPKFGDKATSNLIQAINQAKTRPLSQFLFALGIRHLGQKLADKLATRFGTIENIMQAKLIDLTSIRDFGDAVAASVIEYFAQPQTRVLIEKLLARGLSFSANAALASTIFNNLTFVITGTLSQPRTYYQELIERRGGSVSSQVSRNTNYLIHGQNAGSKLAHAVELKVPLLDEASFNALVAKE